MIVFATHFQTLNAPESHKNIELLKMMFQTAKIYHPDAKLVLLTDQKSNFESPFFEIIRYPIDHYPLRYAETIAEAQYLKNYKEKAHLIFLDFDILVQSNLEELFNEENDLFLTLRPYPIIPINLGISFIREGSQEKVFHFFNKVLAEMLLLEKNEMHWGGSQKAIWRLLQNEMIKLPKEKDTLIYEGLRIKFLKANSYNYSAETVEEMSTFQPDKKILHFKGNLKMAMPIYFEKYFSSNANS